MNERGWGGEATRIAAIGWLYELEVCKYFFYLVRVLLGIGLDGGGCAAIRVALTQHRVDSTAKDLDEDGSGGEARGGRIFSDFAPRLVPSRRHFGDSGPHGDAALLGKDRNAAMEAMISTRERQAPHSGFGISDGKPRLSGLKGRGGSYIVGEAHI
jgi:hypothetical protein